MKILNKTKNVNYKPNRIYEHRDKTRSKRR